MILKQNRDYKLKIIKERGDMYNGCIRNLYRCFN